MDSILLQILFWMACLALFWTYFGYYLFLRIYATVGSRPVKSDDIEPPISLVVTAYNEEQRIAQKLDNCLALDYPVDKLEVMVVSDGSTDRTVDIVASYESRGVKLLAIEKRLGKHHAQRTGLEEAAYDILIFTDASTSLRADSIKKIVKSFADPEVGCVSGTDETDGSTEGEGLYVKYEMELRSLESQVSSLIGVSGSFFAIRKPICETWHSDLSSDFFLPIVAHNSGFRTVLDREAVGSYGLVKEPGKEFQRKVRTVVHGLEVLFRFAELLNPTRHGFFSLQIISHKLMRWLAPFLLCFCLILSIPLSGESPVYQIVLAIQIVLYVAALTAYAIGGLRNSRFFKIPFFFTMVNLSIIVAWYRYLTGERYVTWERTNR